MRTQSKWIVGYSLLVFYQSATKNPNNHQTSGIFVKNSIRLCSIRISSNYNQIKVPQASNLKMNEANIWNKLLLNSSLRHVIFIQPMGFI